MKPRAGQLQLHRQGADAHGGADLHDDFGLTITDANGKTGSDTLRVAITDTTPTAAPDTNSMMRRQRCPNNNTTTGSVLTGTGADTASRTAA